MPVTAGLAGAGAAVVVVVEDVVDGGVAFFLSFEQAARVSGAATSPRSTERRGSEEGSAKRFEGEATPPIYDGAFGAPYTVASSGRVPGPRVGDGQGVE
ncbi:hypothetical protein ASG70_17585 [Phycicoccus sp. Soil748]|nr:hypothetical protein ASG70_17585 [Phycicoccus sp. Soil748]